ncbi:MAG: PPC domain-containing protein [Gemmatimonadota bacterium]|nr:PPC domain-containing protein [Gemmatimonadota bacterium]
MSSFRARAISFLAAAMLAPTASATQVTSVLTLLPTDDRTLEVGGDFSGALSTADYASADDYLMEAWELQGRAGGSVTIDLESDAFDARLYVVGPGLAETLSDDDGGGGCNARLTFTFLENGTFRVVASSVGARETGTYTLRVSERPGPAPSFGCGEVNPATLAALPTEGRSLELGTLAAGILGPNSRTVQDGRAGEAWTLTGQPGVRASIILESDDFDAYLYLTGPGMGEVLTDDDGAGDLNSMIDVTLTSDGPYTVVASALGSGDFGAYTIRVEEAADLNTLPITGGTVDLGQTVDGQLLFADPVILEGRRGQVWGLDATAGQQVVIDLRSDDFDSYLYLVGPGLVEPLSDDDGGDGTNSQITTTLPETGTYRIIASPYSTDDSGSFTLSVSPR